MPVTEEIHPPTRRSGPPPFGWEWMGSALVPVPREQAIRWLILHLHAEGWSLRRISTELDRLRIPTRAGLRAWPIKNLQRVIRSAGENVTGPG